MTALALMVFAAPSQAQLSAAVPRGQTLTYQALNKILTDLAYEPEETDAEIHIYRIYINRDNWKLPYRMYILKDASYIWMDCTLSTVENPEMVPPAALVKLLKENEKIGPAHFALHSTDKYLHIYEPIENRDISNALIRKRIDGFDATVRRTYDLWNPDNFKSTGAKLSTNNLPTLVLTAPSRFPLERANPLAAPKR